MQGSDRGFRLSVSLLLAALSYGCGAPGGTASVTLGPLATISPTPTPFPSLAPTFAPWVQNNPNTMTTSDIILQGDAARIVYPSAHLVPGTLYPVLIFEHGYGMDQTQLSDRTPLAQAAVAQGWLAASPNATGRAHWGSNDALKATAVLISELITNHQADPSRLYMVGFSMGGGTALLAAENRLGLPYHIAAVASTQGFTDLAAMMTPGAYGGAYASSIRQAYGGQPNASLLENHSPQFLADRLKGIPVYLEHGQADTNVPALHSEQMATRLNALGIPNELHLYPGLTHSEQTIHADAIIHFFASKAATVM
jgi:dipeptidyl aminopeptidase/acylaminoacyl peptidase